MGKKNKHSKDKLFKTVSELNSYNANRDLEHSNLYRRFDSLISVPGKPLGLCDDDGFCHVFDSDFLTKFIDKYKVHPITGKEVNSKRLVDLKLHKNEKGQIYCPITMKLFTQHSKILANRKTGEVFSHDAHRMSLTSDDSSDIVVIQDPERPEEKLSEVYYIKNKLRVDVDDDETGSKIRNISQSDVLKSTIEEFKRNEGSIVDTFNKIVGQEKVDSNNVKLDKINSANQSDGAVSRSVTSTVMPIANIQKAAMLNEEEILYPRIKKKGYVQLVTNFGPLNLELYCDRTPKTCHNFLLLATRGYYDNTIFHRLVKNFILQGGDPTGIGSGGQSAWGEPFRNECFADLKHVGRGVLAMANSEPNKNKSQFYITLKGSWDHLDGKHTVFGRVVGGDETLQKIELVETDKKDKPKKEIKIEKIIKYVDPFEEAEKKIEEERNEELESKKRLLNKTSKKPPTQQPLKKFRSGIGAYIDLESFNSKTTTNNRSSGKTQSSEHDSNSNGDEPKLSTEKRAHKYGNFSNW